MALLQQGYAVTPGIHELKETIEMDPTWGRWEINRTWIMGVQLSGTARDRYDDGGGSVVEQTVLRPGLLMEYVSSGGEAGKWRQWIDGGDASTVAGILLYAETTQKYQQDTDKWFGYALVGGQIRADGLVVYGRAAAAPNAGNGSTYGTFNSYDETGQAPAGVDAAAIKAALQGSRQFLFDDFYVAIGQAT